MKNLICTLLMSVALISCGGKHSKVHDAINEINEITPAAMWDGHYLVSTRLVEETNTVEFSIIGAYRRLRDIDSISELRKKGLWYLANFMEAYDYSAKGMGGEGDEEMFKKVGSLLILMPDHGLGMRLKLELITGDLISIDLSPEDVGKAIKMWKYDHLN